MVIKGSQFLLVKLVNPFNGFNIYLVRSLFCKNVIKRQNVQ